MKKTLYVWLVYPTKDGSVRKVVSSEKKAIGEVVAYVKSTMSFQVCVRRQGDCIQAIYVATGAVLFTGAIRLLVE
jgi:hypothetical protein